MAIPRGDVRVLTIASRVLRGNRLRDPHVRQVPVYVPPGYDEEDRAYPLLVALVGFTGSGRMLLNVDPWGEPLNERLDRLQHEGRLGPVVVAMPDAFTRYGGSQYLNSSATGRYEDHLIREVVPAVRDAFRILPGPQHCGVFGKSSGGFGALYHAMRHPEVFGAVACHSGDMAFEYAYLPDFPHFLREVAAHRGVRGFVRAFEAAPRKTNAAIGAMNILAMAASYSPNPDAPLGIDFPMDLHTGALRPAVWRRWLRHDPVRMLERPRHVEALRRMRLVFLDCGSRDEYNLHLGARQFVAGLRQHRVRHHYEEFPDGHRGLSYRYDVSLPRLGRAVRGTRTGNPRAS